MACNHSKAILVYVLARCAAALFLLGTAQAEELIEFRIPAQPLETALLEFADKTGSQVATSSASIADLRTDGVSGRLTPLAALQRLVEGSNIRIRSEGNHSFSLSRTQFRNENAEQRGGAQRQGTSSNSDDSKKKQSLVDENSDSANNDRLETVYVTAQKQSERLLDVPVPVTVLSPETLTSTNELRLQDFYTEVPNLKLMLSSRGEPVASIRGLATAAGTNPVVGITVDDVPFGSSIGIAGGFIAPDFDPGDLAQVEVLRGPQGTLYGASSMGGVIKYVTKDPSTDSLSSRVEGTLTSIEQGNVGGSLRGAINVPTSENLALRFSAFGRKDPGYVDNPSAGEKDVNETTVVGGRAAMLWLPTEAISLKLSAQLQRSELDGSPLVFIQPGLGEFEQVTVANTGTYDRDLQVYGAIADVGLGKGTLTSVTGYAIDKSEDLLDLSFNFGSLAFTNFGVRGAPYADDLDTKKFSQEIRVRYPLLSHFEILAGGFYTNEKTETLQEAFAANPTTGAIAGSLGTRDAPFRFKEWAGFSTLSVNVTEQFSMQFGGRWSATKQTYVQANTGPAFGSTSFSSDFSGNSFTYLATAQYKPTEDITAYFRTASGYRPGGPVANAQLLNLPRTSFDADTTKTYELGLKVNVLDIGLYVDASVYRINWEDIQLSVRSASGFSYQSNAGAAKSEGFELSVGTQLWSDATVQGWVAHTNAVLTEGFPDNSSAFGRAGDPLAFTSPWSGSMSIDQRFRLLGNSSASVGAGVNYVGERVGAFRTTATRQLYPSYTEAELHGKIEWQSWEMGLFVRNLTNSRGLLGGGLGSINSNAFNMLPPRTFGISVVKQFE